MEQFLYGFEASQFVWNSVWKKDSTQHVELNILDVVQLSSSGIIGWLFTSSTGTVKSKTQSRWKYEAVKERATGGGLSQELMCNFYNTSNKKYISIHYEEVLREIFHEKHLAATALITYAHLTGTSQCYMEIVYESPVTLVVAAPPKVTCYTLTDGKAMGRKSKKGQEMEPTALPSERIICLNKLINVAAKEFATSLVKVLESRMRIKVTKLVITVMMETIPLCELPDLRKHDTDKVCDKRFWLHHCSEVSHQKPVVTAATAALNEARNNNRYNGNDVTSDQGSGIAGSLGPSNTGQSVTHSISSTSRTAKLGLTCNGDFCFYNSAEHRRTVAGLDYLDDDEHDIDGDGGGFSVKQEAQRAIARHRKVEDHDKCTAENYVPGEGEDEEDAAALVADPMLELVSPTLNAAVNANQNAMREKLHQQHQNRAVPGGSTVGGTAAQSVPVPLKQMKVTLKSIILAREEMAEIEKQEQLQLLKEMQSFGHKPNQQSTDTSSSEGKGLSSVWPRALVKWWLHIGRSLTQSKAGVVSVPLSSGHNIHKAVISSSSSNPAGDGMSAQHMAQYLEILAANESKGISDTAIAEGFTSQHNNLGHLSWYYSNVKVCENCYVVYRELDRKRHIRLKAMRKAQRTEAEKDEEQRGRDLEKKIFSQRQFVSRLAASKRSNTDRMKGGIATAGYNNNNSLSALNTQSIAGTTVGGGDGFGSGLSYGVLGGNSLAFDSVVGGDRGGGASGSGIHDGYFDQAAAVHYERHIQAKKVKQRQPLVGAPKGALPPLPWKLSDSKQRELYEKTSNTFAVRNIMDKKSLRGEQQQQGKQFGDGDDDAEETWNAATGLNQQQYDDGGDDYSGGMSRNRKHLSNIRSNGYGQKPRRSNPSSGSSAGKKFNADRFLHPWQRDLEKLKQMRAERDRDITQKVLQKSVAADGGQNHDNGEEEEDDDEDGDNDSWQDPQEFQSNVRRGNALPALAHSQSMKGSSSSSSSAGGGGAGSHFTGGGVMGSGALDDSSLMRATATRPPLKPIAQSPAQQTAARSGGTSHFSLLKNMAAVSSKDNSSNNSSSPVLAPISPTKQSLIAATMTRNVHSSGSESASGQQQQQQHRLLQQQQQANSRMSHSAGDVLSGNLSLGRPSTTAQSARPGTTSTSNHSRGSPSRDRGFSPFLSTGDGGYSPHNSRGLDSPLTTDARNGSSGGGLGLGLGIGMGFSPGRQSPQQRPQLKRTDSIAEMDVEDEEDEDDEEDGDDDDDDDDDDEAIGWSPFVMGKE